MLENIEEIEQKSERENYNGEAEIQWIERH
jgi:hypothetical protein